MDHNRIIIKPVITEKATALAEKSKYTFRVPLKVTRLEIKKAIEKIYKVKVLKVNFIMVKSRKRRRGRVSGFSARWKKAIVTLKKGDKIEIFEGV
ncbi:50S ribosomal protein L23 [Patescibacteria group bacterium]